MRTVQMTLDEDLVQMVDRVSKELHVSRSAFTRDALREALARHTVAQQEKRHREGYQRHPVPPGEFDLWAAEQDWGAP